MKLGKDATVFDRSYVCSAGFTPFTMADILIFLDFINNLQEKGDIKGSIKYKKKDIKRILGKEKMKDSEYQVYMNSIYDKSFDFFEGMAYVNYRQENKKCWSYKGWDFTYHKPYDPFVGGYIFDTFDTTRNENRLVFDEFIYKYNIFNEAISNPDGYFISVSVLHSFDDDEKQLMSVPKPMTLKEFKRYADIVKNIYDKDGEVASTIKIKYKDYDTFDYDEAKAFMANIFKQSGLDFNYGTGYSGINIISTCHGNENKELFEIGLNKANAKELFPKERCNVDSTEPIIYLSYQKKKEEK